MPDLHSYPREVGLDLAEFGAALADGRHAGRIDEDLASRLGSGVEGTSTQFIDGLRHAGQYMPDELGRAPSRPSAAGTA